MLNRKYPLFIILLLCGAAPLAAAESSAAQFLRLGFGARALGMGEAFAAVADDISSMYYNPAGLASGEGKSGELMLSHSWHIQDTGLTQLAYGRGRAGLALTYFSAGELEGRDNAGNLGSDFTAEDFALAGGYGVKYGDISAGLALKAVRQRIKTSRASAVCADAGALYTLTSVPLTFGLSVANLGSKIKFEEESFPLPLVYRAAAALRLKGKFPGIIAFQADLPNDSGAVLRAGMEYTGFQYFALRAGYRTTTSSQKDAVLGSELGSSSSGISDFYGFFMGLGFDVKPMRIDYAMLPFGELGNSHRFSVSMRF